MHLRKQPPLVAAVLTACVFAASAYAADYHLERVTPVLNQPTFLLQAPGDASNFVFYSQRIGSTHTGFDLVNTTGGLFRYDLTTRTSTSIFDLSFRKAYNDNGVQNFAFHPDYNLAGSDGYGKVYVASAEYTGTEAVGAVGTNSGNRSLNRVEEFMVLNLDGSFRANADIVNSRKLLLEYQNNNLNTHLVEWVGFDPTATGAARNQLYISTGDGSHNNAYNGGLSPSGRPSQNPSDPKGKILRIDVAGADAYPNDPLKNFAIPTSNPIPVYNAANPATPINGFGEIWATGLRNGYRVSFDRATGDFYYGDVGEAAFEEINFIKAGANDGTAPPVDFGWPQREATHASGVGTAPHSSINPFTGAISQNPIQEYVRTGGQAAIGGIVYRGPIAELQGKYFFADAASSRIFALDFDRDTDPALYTGKNGTLTELTQLWNALVTDPTDPNYFSNVNLAGLGGLDHVVGFCEDAEGNLYVIDFGFGPNFGGLYTANAGEIFKVVAGAPAPTPPTTVWTGGLGNRWDANSSGNANFNTSQTSGTNTLAPPGLNSHVIFSATIPAAANFSTALGRDFFIDRLTVASGSPNVTIASATGTAFTQTLVILGAGGITLEPGAGNLNISSNVMIGSVQNWTNNSPSATFIVGPITGAGGLIINGNLTLTASNNYTGGTTVQSGTVTLSNANGFGGTLAGPITLNAGVVNFTAGPVSVGNGAGSSNRLMMNGGTLTTTGEFWLANATDAYGYLEQNGGVISLGSFLSLARGNGSGSANMRGVANINAGSLSVNTNNLGIGSFNGIATELGGVMTLNGGSISTVGTLLVGNFAGGVLTVHNDAAATANGVNGVTIGNSANVTGILNLNGGNVLTRIVRKGGDSTTTGILNFNGGTLTAAPGATGATFMTGLTRATIFEGGATMDDNGQSLTIAQPLLAPTGNGVTTITLSATLSGYIGPPVVLITGGGGSGATAIANVDSAGTLQSITVTNPGIGYTAPPTVTLVSGGLTTFNNFATAAIAANSPGGPLIKRGTGTVTLTGIATYGGDTTVNAGLLAFNTSGTVSSSIGAVTGAGGLQIAANALLTSNGVTLTGTWTINGRHIIRPGTGNVGTSNIQNLPTIAHTGSGPSAVYTGVLDLTDNALIVETTSPADKQTKIQSLIEALTAGATPANTWTGNGITSGTAAANNVNYAVGIFDNALLQKTAFAGQPVNNNSLFLSIARYGDTNLDGIIDINDLGNLANNWQQAGDTWDEGDFNRDGFVDINDLGILASNWQQTSAFPLLLNQYASPNSQPTNIPEPATALLLILGAPLLSRGRRPRSTTPPVLNCISSEA